MTASDGVQSGVNSLLPKLQTRLVVLPGAINTHQLHRHYTSQNATANRLLQRLAFPEQLNARYTAGVFPTKGIQGRYQRYQRSESLAGGESLVNVSVVQCSTGNDSGWQQAEQIRIPAGEESTSTPPISNNLTSPRPPGTYRVSHRPNLTFNSLPGSISVTTDVGNADSTEDNPESAPVNSLTPSSPNAIANADSTAPVTPTPNFTPNPSQSSASSIQLKMQTQADNHPEVKVVTTTHTPATIQRKYADSEGLQSTSESLPRVLYRVAHKKGENLTPPALSVSTGAEELGSSSNYTSDSNLGLNSSVTTAQASLIDGDKVANTTQANGVNIQRKYHQSELLWHPSHDTTEVLARPGGNNVYDNTKSISINTLANVTPARETHTAGSRTPLAALVQTKPLSLIIPGEQGSGENFPIPNQSNLPLFTTQAGINNELPLAISPNNNRGLISRQITTAPVESVTSETINAIPNPTAPTSPSPLNTSVDIVEIAEQVSRIILRRLVVERERRGMGK